MSLFDLFWLVKIISKLKEKNSQKRRKPARYELDKPKMQDGTACWKFTLIKWNPKWVKEQYTCTGLSFLPALVKWSPANLAFLFDFDKVVSWWKIIGSGRAKGKCGNLTGMKRLWRGEMELVSGFLRFGQCVWKAGAGEMELGTDIALVQGKEPLLPWGSYGLWAERADWATGSGEARTGFGSEKASDANVPDEVGCEK